MVTVKAVQKFDCDVLIAGGGPAGSGLAFHLATKGYKVIVAEAEQFPRDKVCGDGVSPIALAELHAMGITGLEKFAKANEINKVGLFIKDDKVFIDLSKPDHLPFHARIIPRVELDHWIYEAAKKAGAVYMESTRVTAYETNADAAVVQLKQGQKTLRIKTKLVVGADGSSSTIARQLHGAKPKDEFQLLGLRSYYENVNGPTDRVDIYFTGETFPGIFWMFPKGPDGANIGMAMVSKTLPHKPSHVKELLATHIKNNPDIRERIGSGMPTGKIDGWPISFFNPQDCITANRVLLAGDAAGLINPLSGDGIQYALLSARWAAVTIAGCLEKNDLSAAALYAYRKTVDKEVGYDFALSNLLVQFPRNKTLTPVWMAILTVMIARAKEDKHYADIIAGIFEGTYPSHKALTASFILKSLRQGGKDLEKLVAVRLADPASMIHGGLSLSQTALQILEGIKDHPREHGQWVANTVNKTIAVAGHAIKHMAGKRARVVD